MRAAAALAALCVAASACSPADPGAEVSCRVVDYGAGVFYFDCVGGFGAALAAWRSSHPGPVSVSDVGINSHGTTGHWVVLQ